MDKGGTGIYGGLGKVSVIFIVKSSCLLTLCVACLLRFLLQQVGVEGVVRAQIGGGTPSRLPSFPYKAPHNFPRICHSSGSGHCDQISHSTSVGVFQCWNFRHADVLVGY